MGGKTALGGMTNISGGGKVYYLGLRQLISLDKKMQLFPCNILYWFRHLRSYASIDFRRYILGFCVVIYFHENSSVYAVRWIVARIDAVHGINSIPAWDRLRPASAGDAMKQCRGKYPLPPTNTTLA